MQVTIKILPPPLGGEIATLLKKVVTTMIMNTNILESIGLTKSEVKVYLALLELGSTSAGKIISKSGVASSKIYELLEKLTQKGLCSTVMKAGVNHYTVAPPERIMDYLKEKEKKTQQELKTMEKLLPALQATHTKVKEKSEIEVYSGLKGIQSVFAIIRNTLIRQPYYVFGARTGVNEAQRALLLRHHKERIQKGTPLKILFSKDLQNITKPYENMKLTEVRYLEKDLLTPTQTMIVKDMAIIILWTDHPMGIVINNKEIAQSYLKYFWYLWKVTSKNAP